MNNSCKLKLEWIPVAYSATDNRANDTFVAKPKQAHPVNGIYISGNGFAKAHKKKV